MGVLSGTSADAAEAALCRIRGSGAQLTLELVAHASLPFSDEFSERVISVATVADACALNFELGERFAKAALAVIAKAGLRPDDVDVIGSHGQTVAHLPPGMGAVASTLQLGEASVIAERTGIPVVSDFRTRDMAAGGHGAPLVPYLDWALFRPGTGARILQNLGGIGNVSVVSERLKDTLAFDTGPANMMMDAFSVRATSGRERFDRDGTLSSRGTVIPELLEELLRHPFLATPPPRSGGRESFGEPLVSKVWARYGGRPEDVIRTALELTVEATARAYEQWVLPLRRDVDGVYVSGGGCRNPNVMARLKDRLAPLPVQSVSALGFPEEAKEAACFALLASEALSGTAQNVPAATGASKPVVMGKMTP